MNIKVTAHDFGTKAGEFGFAASSGTQVCKGLDKLKALIGEGNAVVTKVSVTSSMAPEDFIETTVTLTLVERV